MKAFQVTGRHYCWASMKALPKRKGNVRVALEAIAESSLNESPSEKEGKYLYGWAGEQ